jgi:hypothetical protein
MQGLGRGEIRAEFNFIFLLRSNPVPRGNPYPHRYKFGKIEKSIDLKILDELMKQHAFGTPISSNLFHYSLQENLPIKLYLEQWNMLVIHFQSFMTMHACRRFTSPIVLTCYLKF